MAQSPPLKAKSQAIYLLLLGLKLIFSIKISFKGTPYKSQHISSSILIFSFHLRLYVIKRFFSGFTKMFIGIYHI